MDQHRLALLLARVTRTVYSAIETSLDRPIGLAPFPEISWIGPRDEDAVTVRQGLPLSAETWKSSDGKVSRVALLEDEPIKSTPLSSQVRDWAQNRRSIWVLAQKELPPLRFIFGFPVTTRVYPVSVALLVRTASELPDLQVEAQISGMFHDGFIKRRHRRLHGMSPFPSTDEVISTAVQMPIGEGFLLPGRLERDGVRLPGVLRLDFLGSASEFTGELFVTQPLPTDQRRFPFVREAYCSLTPEVGSRRAVVAEIAIVGRADSGLGSA